MEMELQPSVTCQEMFVWQCPNFYTMHIRPKCPLAHLLASAALRPAITRAEFGLGRKIRGDRGGSTQSKFNGLTHMPRSSRFTFSRRKKFTVCLHYNHLLLVR
jgi:hypothetical protein